MRVKILGFSTIQSSKTSSLVSLSNSKDTKRLYISHASSPISNYSQMASKLSLENEGQLYREVKGPEFL
jgi:hypothetical protein